MHSLDVYLYGMTCLSTIHILDGDYPEPDSYREIKNTIITPSGETGNAALLLANFGLKVKADGPYLGRKTKKPTLDLYNKHHIDCSGMKYDSSFDGVEDLILVDANSRTIFGKFGNYLSSKEKKWSKPNKIDIKDAKVVSLDPFFGEDSKLAAEHCVAYAKKYVTIDLKPDDFIHRHAAVTIISDEFTQREFPGANIKKQIKKYSDNTEGLVVFTFGNREILYCRKNQGIKKFIPFTVKAKGTLAAGDFFRAGAVYGVLQGYEDEKIIKFAAAVGALACEHFPAALNLPSLKEVLNLI